MKVKHSIRQTPDRELFWKRPTPCEHIVHFYENENIFLDTLEGFVVGGLRIGESVIVIATPAHLAALTKRLHSYGADVPRLRKEDHLIYADAGKTLAKFMVKDHVDEVRLTKLTNSLLDRARKDGRGVRAFGEMVSLLWEQGRHQATIQLERFWHRLCHEQSFSVFCGYPHDAFSSPRQNDVREICRTHTKVMEAVNFSQIGKRARAARTILRME